MLPFGSNKASNWLKLKFKLETNDRISLTIDELKSQIKNNHKTTVLTFILESLIIQLADKNFYAPVDNLNDWLYSRRNFRQKRMVVAAPLCPLWYFCGMYMIDSKITEGDLPHPSAG